MDLILISCGNDFISRVRVGQGVGLYWIIFPTLSALKSSKQPLSALRRGREGEAAALYSSRLHFISSYCRGTHLVCQGIISLFGVRPYVRTYVCTVSVGGSNIFGKTSQHNLIKLKADFRSVFRVELIWILGKI